MNELLEFAAEHLPAGYRIEIGVEQGAAWANLLDDADDEVAEGLWHDGPTGWAGVIGELVNEAREREGLPLVDVARAFAAEHQEEKPK